MNKKNYILIAIALVLAGVYVVYFTDWFQPKIIQIATQQPARPDFPDRRDDQPVVLSASTTTIHSPRSRSSRSPRCKPTSSPSPSGTSSRMRVPMT